MRWHRAAVLLLPLAVLYLSSCSKNPVTIREYGRLRPETELTYAPLETDTTTFRVHLYWYGYDRDGEVVQYRFAIDEDTLKPVSYWRATKAHDSTFVFQVQTGSRLGGHEFRVVAEDNDGWFDPTPAKRFITIRTVPPYSWITSGPANGAATGFGVQYASDGIDPDGGRLGNPAHVDSFEYIMLWPGRAIVDGHPPLPDFSVGAYEQLLNAGTGPTLQPPYDDWKWTRSGPVHRFTSMPPGVVVIAERAVDPAGAKDTLLTYSRNIRVFTVKSYPPSNMQPLLTFKTDLVSTSGQSQSSTPAEIHGQVLEGTTVHVSWSGAPGASGMPIMGYAAALDDTTLASWSIADPHLTSMSLAGLSPGDHSLFVRVEDQAGLRTTVIVQIHVIHPLFRDAATPLTCLYVDDFAPPPGDWATAVRETPNFPTDITEDAWWTSTIFTPLAAEFGYSFEQVDPVYQSQFSYERTPPSLEELARYRVVIWYADFTNTLSSPTALWNALHGQAASALAQYVRGGGTLILTGFQLASQSSRLPDLPNSLFDAGLCSDLPTSVRYPGEYFLRDDMGINGAKSNDVSRRAMGARDFVEARVTPGGSALGFQTAPVDTGAFAYGAKWDPSIFLSYGTNADALLAPGLPKVEGWKLETALGCSADESGYRRENPALPIAIPLYTYHGVNEGALQDGPPSPREDLVTGIATQAHDDGSGDGSVVTPGHATNVTGRMVFLGFPIYYIKDAQAYAIMRAAFAYVNASPTLPQGTP